ncbi:MAG: molybdopterin-guanine dinucleotide biosynthesis protein MobB [Firmicutes bacterium]|nr:molybdopterin-guanine dinucleotide biosynthesis protein MobB [Bacillota bacterium]
MKVLHIAGPSNSGKTRLIASLIQRLDVHLVVKWSHHTLGAELPTQDTAQFGQRGAPTILATPDGLVYRPGLSRPRVYQYLARLLPRDAIVVVEGDKSAPHPKIWLGADLPSEVWALSLVIGPHQPCGTTPWYPARVPLSQETVERLAQHLADQWPRYSYDLQGGDLGESLHFRH